MLADLFAERAEALRRTLGATLQRRIVGPDGAQRHAEVWDAPGERWFADDSPVRVVHADTAMYIGGLLAVFTQSMHPLAMAGVAQHSSYRSDPWGRLNRTADFIGVVTFGPRVMADQSIAVVRRIHDRVVGHAPDGRPYAANDPHLLLWVHVAEVDAFIAAHRRYGEVTLSDADYDRYLAEMAEVAEALGSDPAPRSRAALAAALRRFEPELGATDDARDAARYLLYPGGLSLTERLGYAPVVGAAIGLLPLTTRVALRLPVPPVTGRLVTPVVAGAAMRIARWVRDEPEAT